MKMIYQAKQLWNAEAPMVVFIAAAMILGFHQ